jgi:hypothetical protein
MGEATIEVDDLTAPVLDASATPLLVASAPTPPKVGASRTLRRSNRNAEKADEHALLKTERLAKKKNLKGNSFSSFSYSRIISNLGRVGINLATSYVVLIKNLEVDRLVLRANKNIKVNTTNLISDDEREERLEEVLHHAYGKLNERLLDAENDHIIDLSPITRKEKNIIMPRIQEKTNFPKIQNHPSMFIIK